ATGGGLPVEVWSRFMKAAHQRAPATDLPIASAAPASPGSFASGPFASGGLALPGTAPAYSAAPIPAAPVPGRGRAPIRAGHGTERAGRGDHRRLADGPVVPGALKADRSALSEHRRRV